MDIGYKLAAGIASAGAGFAANKAVGAGWKGVTGREVPSDDTDEDFGLKEILIFAVVSSAVIAVAQVFAARAIKKYVGKMQKQEQLPA